MLNHVTQVIICIGCWCNCNSKLYLVLPCLHIYAWFDLKTLISSHFWHSVWNVFVVHWEMPLLGRLRMATVLLINSWGKQICLLSLYTIRKNYFKVSLWARTPIFSELIQVSTGLGVCLFPPMMGCQVITKVTANVILDYQDCSTPPPTFLRYPRKFCGILLNTLVEEDTWGICRQNCSVIFA